MRGRRFQKPRVINKKGYWIAQYRDLEGRKRKVSLGPVSKTKKFDAETKLSQILDPINAIQVCPSAAVGFAEFVKRIYLPFYRRKWKGSTVGSNENRLSFHLVNPFGERALSSFTRDELQGILDEKASAGLSYSVVAHLRWDLRQIFHMAVTEAYLLHSPAELLFIPRNAPRPDVASMTFEQVRLFFSVLELRERVIGGLAVLGGMRPGEIFALRRSGLENRYINITQRIYRGKVDTPKTFNSRRWAAFGTGLSSWIREWLEMIPGVGPEAWVFPSERATTPLLKDNCWRRNFLPRLQKVVFSGQISRSCAGLTPASWMSWGLILKFGPIRWATASM